MITDRIRENMTVISADDRSIGCISRVEENGLLRVTSVSGGCGYDHLIPLSWVNEVGEHVFLDKASAYIAANWRPLAVKSGGTPLHRVSGSKPPRHSKHQRSRRKTLQVLQSRSEDNRLVPAQGG